MSSDDKKNDESVTTAEDAGSSLPLEEVDDATDHAAGDDSAGEAAADDVNEDEEGDADEGDAEEGDADERDTAAPRRFPSTFVLSAAAIVLVVALAAVAWVYFFQYRPDQSTNAAAQKVALDAASGGTVSLLSYSPETLDKDFAAAKTHLTGDFLAYYTQFTQEIVTPAAREKQVRTSASIARAAISTITPQSAEVLIFVNQNTSSKANPGQALSASSVKVGLSKVDGQWLISSFDPV